MLYQEGHFILSDPLPQDLATLETGFGERVFSSGSIVQTVQGKKNLNSGRPPQKKRRGKEVFTMLKFIKESWNEYVEFVGKYGVSNFRLF